MSALRRPSRVILTCLALAGVLLAAPATWAQSLQVPPLSDPPPRNPLAPAPAPAAPQLAQPQLPPPAPQFPQPSSLGAYLAARQALAEGDFVAAAPYLDQVLRNDPDNPAMLEAALIAHAGLGNIDRAVTLAQRLEDLDITSQTGQLVLVVDLLGRGNTTLALDLLSRPAAVGPVLGDLLAAWAELARGSMSETLRRLESVADRPGAQEFGLYHQALALAHVGDFEGADTILSGNSDVPLQLARRGTVARLQILSQLDRHGEALDLMDRAFIRDASPETQALRTALEDGAAIAFDIVTTPRDGMAEVLFDLGEALRFDQDYQTVLVYARLARHLRPNHMPAAILAGQALDAMGQHQLAIDIFESVPHTHPAFHRAAMGKADALRKGGRFAQAVDLLRDLVETHEGVVEVQVALADLLRDQEDYAGAVPAYDRAIELLGTPEPQHWFLFYARAICHERIGNWEQAEADFRLALELDPDNPHALNYLGYTLVEQGRNMEEALEMIERAVEQAPESGHIIDSLAWALYRMGRYEEALEPMERAVELLPRDAVLNDHLGDIYWALGRQLEARFQWRRALDFGPHDDLDSDRVRRKLETGLDRVLIDEGGEPHQPIAASGN